MEIILSSAVIIVGGLLLLSKKFTKLGSLVAGLGFVPFSLYVYATSKNLLFLIAGIAIAVIAVFRFYRPYKVGPSEDHK